MSQDADRTRRTFHDLWVPRVLYPAGLLTPWFATALPLRGLCLVYGMTLLGLWIAGLVFVARRGRFLSPRTTRACCGTWSISRSCASTG